MLTAPMVIFAGGFLGLSLAPSLSLATLPVASMVVGSALASMPAAFIMQRIGRRRGFMYATLIALLGSVLAFYSVRNANFLGLCFSIGLLGAHLTFVQQFRFAALEWVKPEQAATTASVVLLGGLFAAWLGPELAMLGKDLFSHLFSGAFILLAVAHFFIFLLLLLSFIPFAKVPEQKADHSKRSVLDIISTPAITAAMISAAVAYGVMNLIMTATPVSMSEIQNYPLIQTKTVIQSHIMAMFLPSLFSPFILRWLSTVAILIMGIMAMCISISVALTDQGYWFYWTALVFLGLGWIFLFVGGTALLAQNYQAHERFKVQAINEGFVFSVQAIMSLSAGWHALNLLAIPLLILALLVIARWVLSEKSAKT